MDDNLLGFVDSTPAPTPAGVQPPADFADTQGSSNAVAPTYEPPQGVDVLSAGTPTSYMDPFQGVPIPADANPTGTSVKAIPEMTKLREWEDNHERQLEEFARSEEEKKRQQRQAASDEVRQWYEERSAATKKRLESNRADADVIAKAKDDGPKSSGNPWEQVADLIDLSARVSDDARDTSRMRSLLIQLKASPVTCAA